MANYKRDAASNRDALFGGTGGGKSSSAAARKPPPSTRSQPSTAPRPAPAPAPAPRPPSTLPTPTASSPDDYADSFSPGPSALFSSKLSNRHSLTSILSGQAKIDKMAQAEDFRLKAQKAMSRGIFSRPDPISAGNYYKRAADAYKSCGENRLERLHRIASGDCQLGQDAYASAAQEYTRAAELAERSEENLERKRKEVHKLHLDAASAWAQMGERGRAAESAMKAAWGLVMGEEVSKPANEGALKSVEEAIESFVPDPLNKKRNYRRGRSAYDAPDATEEGGRKNVELARQNVVTEAFAHETLFKVANELIKRRHYETALYAMGAGIASLEEEGIATISLGRAYLSETIVTLAVGDTVAASKDFQSHLQNTAYLSSRECALEEDLVRACSTMDSEALEETRSKSGSHRAALANLDPVLRNLVSEIRVSGRAKKVKAKPPAEKPANVRTTKPETAPQPELTGAELQQSLDDGFAEMDNIMNEMGLNGDDDELDLT